MPGYAILPVLLSCGNPQYPPTSGPEAVELRSIEVPCGARAHDADRDGIADDCEIALARAFAPVFRTAEGGCNWDTSVRPARLGGEYLFAVEPRSGGAARIAFLPAYYRDCGWAGLKCWLPFVDCRPHVGDSEFIVVDIAPIDQATWRIEAIFLSAHCFSGSSPQCRWFKGSDLQAFEYVNTSGAAGPIVWVAEGRQANYPGQAECDRGHSSIDTCDRNVAEYRYPIRSMGQNIGSGRRPAGTEGGCLTARAVGSASSRTKPDAIECFWRMEVRFGGWQADPSEPGSTPYARYLAEIADFM